MINDYDRKMTKSPHIIVTILNLFFVLLSGILAECVFENYSGYRRNVVSRESFFNTVINQ